MLMKNTKIHNIVKLLLFLTIFFLSIAPIIFPSKLEASTITLDEHVFNSLVKDARMLEVVSDELAIYKDAYKISEQDFEDLSKKHDELVLKYQVLISQYETLDKTYDNLDKQNLKTIELQENQILNLKRKNNINNWLVYSLITSGIAISINNEKYGAAGGFAGVGLLYYYLNK